MGLFSRTLSRLDELKKALTRDPASRQFLALADEYRRQGLRQEAIDVLEKGLAQSPTSVAGHVALGRLLQQAGRLDDALSSYQAALRLDPQNLVALRQTADLHLSRGEKIEAIKKLKLFRGLSPGDREVNELIHQLDEELSAAAAPKPPALPVTSTSPFPASGFRTGPIPAAVAPMPPPPPIPSLPVPPPRAVEPPSATGPRAEAGSADGPPPASVAAVEVAAEPPFEAAAPAGAASLAADVPPFEQAFPFEGAREPEEAAPAPPPVPGPWEAPAAGGSPWGDSGFDAGDLATARVPGVPVEEAGGRADAPISDLSVTETLADLLRSQGHLGEAAVAYRKLAGMEPDPARARSFLALAESISAARAGTVRGRLEAWVEPFSRKRDSRESDLVVAIEEVVERLGPSAAVVTDLEGVPVVSAGPRSEAEAMENLAAELTAFWKNARRSREEIGEGTLDSLVLSGSSGTAAVKLITPAYALLVKTGPGIPVGRVRFEATRAAAQLRPALL